MNKFWNFTDNGDGSRTLFLCGSIADESWYDDDITPKAFREELNAGRGDVVIWINSPGGDCVAAAQIYNMLMDYPGNVTVKIDGIAASAASVIAMAGTQVLMSPTALMMIHNPLTVAIGDSEEMQKAIDKSNDIVGSNRDRSRDICEKKPERNSRANPQKPTTRVGRIAKERHKDPR